MTIWEAILLGIVQGLTEFLPVSSSGHLVIVPELLNLSTPPVAFDVLLHFSSALAVIGYFAQDIYKMINAFLRPRSMPRAEMRTWRRLFVWLVIGTIPAGALGLLFRNFFESLFGSTLAVGALLMVTGSIMLIADLVLVRTHVPRRSIRDMGLIDSLVVGLFQALAIAPGLSRSGLTISGGVYLGFDRQSAARFSFLLSVPAILGAGLLNLGDLVIGFGEAGAAYTAGAVASFFASVLAVYSLLRFLRSHRFTAFIVYTMVLGAFVVVLSLA
ncbi:MAG: undecaprenyl-diphosphate phosphatase [Actinobacteria bacterium]|nr:undecaprenyl-diphosphate phosphatase [Actinomycetota bacterium]